MADETVTIHVDGAARGNPGPAAFAYVIARPGAAPVEHGERMGDATNNVAEYTALVRVLTKAAELGLKRLRVLSDSELMTIVIWDGLCEPHKNMSSLYDWVTREYSDCFPKLPKYQNFVSHIHRLLTPMVWLLQSLLVSGAALRFAWARNRLRTRSRHASPGPAFLRASRRRRRG